MKIDRETVTPVVPLPGFSRRTLATGAAMMIVEWTMEAGAFMPFHHHVHEQVGYLVDGEVEMIIDGKTHLLRPGDSYAVASGVEHAGRVLRPSVMIDIFSPPRDDYRG